MTEKINVLESSPKEEKHVDDYQGTNIEEQEESTIEELLHDLVYGDEDSREQEIRNFGSLEKLLEHRKKYLEAIRNGMKDMVKEWYDLIKPKYIFLTETAGVPFGYIFKEMWRGAYPEEDLPRFYRIDPRFVASYLYNDDRGPFDPEKDMGVEYLRKRVTDRDANVVIFDESIATGSSLRVIQLNLSHGRHIEGQYWDDNDKLISRNREFVENHALKDDHLFLYWGFGPKGKDNLRAGMLNGSSLLGKQEPRAGANIEIHPVPDEIRVTEKFTRGHQPDKRKGLTSNIKRGPEGKVAFKNIAKLKRLGRLLGEEMKIDSETSSK
jgi:hypothetical protein